jgi:hypothetical protein
MFRRLLALTCALAVVGALSWGANAAPISGSFSLDIVFYPQHNLSAGDPINKIDLIDVKFEADLILTLSISGLDITSTTVFTFLGVEFQSFVISATVGALTIKDTIIFSPTFFEFEELRNQYGQVRYCVESSKPSVAGSPASCFFPAYPNLNAGIADVDFGSVGFHDIFLGGIHPVAQNLILARWIQGLDNNHLNDIIQFRKKIADLSLNIAGLVLNVKALFANVSPSQTGFLLRSGLVLAMEGKTVSGVGVRGELWLGAKQGFECFGECKPLERFFNQMVTGGGFNNLEEEKLFLTNVVIAGIRNDLRAEFHFELRQCTIDQVDNDGDGWFGEDPTANGTDEDLDGSDGEDPINVVTPLCYVELTQSGVIAPWRLSFATRWNWNGNLDLLSNVSTFQLKAGDMSVAATFIWRATGQLSFTPGLANFVTTFDPPGLSVTSNILFCSNVWYCDFAVGGLFDGFFLPPVVSHVLSFTGTVGPLSIAATAILDGGILGEFAELDVDMSVTVGAATFTSSTVLLVDQLAGQAISLSFKF